MSNRNRKNNIMIKVTLSIGIIGMLFMVPLTIIQDKAFEANADEALKQMKLESNIPVSEKLSLIKDTETLFKEEFSVKEEYLPYITQVHIDKNVIDVELVDEYKNYYEFEFNRDDSYIKLIYALKNGVEDNSIIEQVFN